MDKIERIKKRIEGGYTMSGYGTKENLYWTMRRDIQNLMFHIDSQKLPIDLVVGSDEWKADLHAKTQAVKNPKKTTTVKL